MEPFLDIVVLALMVIGLTLVIIAQTRRTANHPSAPTLNFRYWIPLWQTRDWFTPAGFRYHIWGWSIFSIGVMGMVLRYLC